MRPAALVLMLGLAALSVPSRAAEDDGDSELARFCSVLEADARETRHALMEDRLDALRREIEERRDELRARSDELAGWIERREAFLALADDALVAIYAAMRPDSAAEQLALVEPIVGAALVMRLKPRQASGILASMPTERAAELVSIISAAGEREP